MNWNRLLVAASGLLVYGALAGCAPSDTDTGSTTTTTGTESTTSSESTTTATEVDDSPPTLEKTVVGSPLWEPVDFHQFSASQDYESVVSALLAPPDHTFHPALGIGPGAAHPGPYDTELGQSVAALGYEEHSVFPKEDGLPPKLIYHVWMVVPSEGAPTGKTPDFDSGPMIPNTVFPIHVTVEFYHDDMPIDGYYWEFDVPALNMTLDPPFDVDGHSHFPIFGQTGFSVLPNETGTVETRVSMIDADGNGWDLSMDASTAP